VKASTSVPAFAETIMCMVSRGEKDRRSRRQARASVAMALASLIVAPAPEIAGPPSVNCVRR